eukprot:gene14776-22619_t
MFRERRDVSPGRGSPANRLHIGNAPFPPQLPQPQHHEPHPRHPPYAPPSNGAYASDELIVVAPQWSTLEGRYTRGHDVRGWPTWWRTERYALFTDEHGAWAVTDGGMQSVLASEACIAAGDGKGGVHPHYGVPPEEMVAWVKYVNGAWVEDASISIRAAPPSFAGAGADSRAALAVAAEQARQIEQLQSQLSEVTKQLSLVSRERDEAARRSTHEAVHASTHYEQPFTPSSEGRDPNVYIRVKPIVSVHDHPMQPIMLKMLEHQPFAKLLHTKGLAEYIQLCRQADPITPMADAITFVHEKTGVYLSLASTPLDHGLHGEPRHPVDLIVRHDVLASQGGGGSSGSGSFRKKSRPTAEEMSQRGRSPGRGSPVRGAGYMKYPTSPMRGEAGEGRTIRHPSPGRLPSAVPTVNSPMQKFKLASPATSRRGSESDIFPHYSLPPSHSNPPPVHADAYWDASASPIILRQHHDKAPPPPSPKHAAAAAPDDAKPSSLRKPDARGPKVLTARKEAGLAKPAKVAPKYASFGGLTKSSPPPPPPPTARKRLS